MRLGGVGRAVESCLLAVMLYITAARDERSQIFVPSPF